MKRWTLGPVNESDAQFLVRAYTGIRHLQRGSGADGPVASSIMLRFRYNSIGWPSAVGELTTWLRRRRDLGRPVAVENSLLRTTSLRPNNQYPQTAVVVAEGKKTQWDMERIHAFEPAQSVQ